MKEFLKQYYETAKQIIIKPIDFFKAMPVTGGYKEPSIFVIVTIMFIVILMQQQVRSRLRHTRSQYKELATPIGGLGARR